MLVNLVILALPLGGIAVLRIYESALVRQTESELVAQSAFIAASYRAALHRLSAGLPSTAESLSSYGLPLPPDAQRPERWQPRPPRLDLASDPVLPPRPDPQPAPSGGDALALTIGRELSPVLREAQRVTLAGLRVVDFRGVVVASTGYDVGRSLAHLTEVQRALAGRPVSLLRARDDEPETPPLGSISRGGRIRAVVAGPIVYENRIVAAVLLARTPNNIVKALHGKLYLLLQAGLTLLGTVALLTLFTSLTISRPLSALMAQARRAARGEKGAVTPLTRPVTREIDQLSHTLAAMARALEQRADYIRGFAAHVSHEFKTPLAAMHGALELLQDHHGSMSPAQRQQFLTNLQGDVDRLERLVRRLLELARADVMRGDGGGSDAAAVLRQVAARWRDRGLDVELRLDGAAGGGDAGEPVAIGAEPLAAVLDSLLDNARQHGGNRVRVTLSLARDPTGRRVVSVDDDGPGVSAANAARVFEPFFTTSRERGGTGMGLAIARALLLAHGADIRLRRHADAAGARFTVHLDSG